MKILTIDWDFFINVPFGERNNKYPQIQSGFRKSVPDNSLWKDVDLSSTTLFSEDLNKLLEALSKTEVITSYVSENHAEVLTIFENIPPNTIREVVNIDFHHDFYLSGGRESCDNWGSILHNRYPHLNFYWVCRNDSIKTTFGEPVPVQIMDFETLLNWIQSGEFQVIHLCRSDLFSPPIFDPYFKILQQKISDITTVKVHTVEPLEERGTSFNAKSQ